MIEKKPKTPAAKNTPKSKHDQGKPGDKAADSSPEPVAVDRSGFELGGSTGNTSAGTGIGLGSDAFEHHGDLNLPGRRGKSKK